MDAIRFDRLTRAVSMRLSRRTLASALGLGALALPSPADAKKKRTKSKQITRNEFGCVNVGGFCKNAGQCCSGICQGKKPKKGKKDKRRCAAHDVLDCPTGADTCLQSVACGIGGIGRCWQTTGQASFCAIGAICQPCTKDGECESVAGPGAGAACIVCDTECEGEESGGTACAGAPTP